MTLIDSVARFIPGVPDEASAIEDSFADGLLDCPHHTPRSEDGSTASIAGSENLPPEIRHGRLEN